jgi:hypothetical protein
VTPYPPEPKKTPYFRVIVHVIAVDENGDAETNKVEVRETDITTTQNRITNLVAALLPAATKENYHA